MAANRTVSVTLTAYVTPFVKGLDTAANKLVQFSRKADLIGSSLKNVGRTMSAAISLPAGGFLSFGLKAFSDFDNQITESTALIKGITEEQRKSLEDLAISLSNKTVRSAKEYAEGYKWLLQSGLDVQQTMASIEDVSNLAIAGTMELDDTVNKLMSSLSAMNMKSKDMTILKQNVINLSDEVVNAANMSQADVSDMLDAVANQAAASSRMYGISMEEMMATLAAFAEQGLKGKAAGTQFAIVLREIQRSANKAGKAWENILGKGKGISIYDQNGNLRSLLDIFSAFDSVFSSLSNKEKVRAFEQMKITFRSSKGIAMLLGQSGKLREFYEGIQKSGEAARVAEEKQKSFAAQIKKMWNNIKNFAIVISKELVPYLEIGIAYITGLMKAFQDLDPGTKKAIAFALVFATLLGPVVLLLGAVVSFFIKLTMLPLLVFSTLMSALTFIVVTIPAVVAAITGLGAVGGTVLGVGLVAGLVAIPPLFIMAKAGIEDFIDSFDSLSEKSSGFFSNFSENMGILVTWLKDNAVVFETNWKYLWDNIGSIMINAIGDAIVYSAKNFISSWISVGETITNILFNAINAGMDLTPDWLKKIMGLRPEGERARNAYWGNKKSFSERYLGGYNMYASASDIFTGFSPLNFNLNKDNNKSKGASFWDKVDSYASDFAKKVFSENNNPALITGGNNFTPDRKNTAAALQYGTVDAYTAAYKNSGIITEEEQIKKNTGDTASHTKTMTGQLNDLIKSISKSNSDGALITGDI